MEEIYLPKSLEHVGDDAFLGCSSLKHVYVPYGEIKRFSIMLPNLDKISEL